MNLIQKKFSVLRYSYLRKPQLMSAQDLFAPAFKIRMCMTLYFLQQI